MHPEFAATLPDRLQLSTVPESNLSIDLHYQIDELMLLNPATGAARIDELDARGTALWNLSTRLRREEGAGLQPKTICLGNDSMVGGGFCGAWLTHTLSEGLCLSVTRLRTTAGSRGITE